MKEIDAKSLQIFEDMKIGLYERGFEESCLIINEEEPLRYAVEIDSSLMTGVENLHSTLWAQYFPDCQFVSVGVTFMDRIPDEKIPVTMAVLNTMNGNSLLEHLTLCPVCQRIDAITEIYLTKKELHKEKFQTLLSNAETNAYFLHPIIRQIAEEYSIDQLISIFCKDNPDFEKYCGGKP